MSGRFQFSAPKKLTKNTCNIKTTLKEEEEKLPTIEVSRIIFNIVGFDEILSGSAVEVTQAEGAAGLSDLRMGTINPDEKCMTCYRDMLECTGHFGHIILAEPIPHSKYIRKLIQILNSVCNSCGGLILSNETIESLGILIYTGDTRLNELEKHSLGQLCYKAAEGKTKCTRNPVYIPQISVDEGIIIYYTDDPKNRRRRKTQLLLDILSKLTESDIKMLGLGFTNPVDYITRVLPVLPPCDRPTEVIDEMYHPSSLTLYYVEIVKINEAMKVIKNNPDMSTEYDKKLSDLIFTISHFIDNSDGQYTRNNKVWEGLKQKLGTKEGLIRKNIQGKRVEFAGRSVLSPDPNLKFGQLRVPREWVSTLTIKERVNRYNLKTLTALLRAGKIERIIRKNGFSFQMNEKRRQTATLTIGESVARHLRDGDYVAFNRQPTLHKESFMGFELVIGWQKTIGLHLSYTTPLNADFDGDEGNVHVPQDVDVEVELREILNVKRCIMSAEDNAPSMGVVYDVILGIALLTLKNPIIDRNIFNDSIMKITNDKALSSLHTRLARYGVHPYSGRALFSALLPADFYYTKFYKDKPNVVIKEGILISGFLTKPDVGTVRNSIIQVLAKKYGYDRAADFLTDSSFVINSWLAEYGFTVGYEDLSIKKTVTLPGGIVKVEDVCERLAEEEVAKTKLIVDSFNINFDNPIEQQKAERDVVAKLGDITAFGGKLVKENLPLENNLGLMVVAGSKGSTFNIAQITALLGQQTIKGNRPRPTLRRAQGGKTNLVCTTYDVEGDVESRGLCINSFKKGLNPREYFLHQTASREGLIDTAQHTADIGSMNHRIIRALEDITVHQDGSVRNSKGVIYETLYGEDGFNAAKLQVVPSPYGDEIASFIDLRSTVFSINSQFGFSTNNIQEEK